MPVLTPSIASIVIVYAVRFGSAFCETICGSSSRAAKEGVMGAQTYPEVCRIRNADLAGVKSEAAMIKSPSFSRSGLSSTTTNSPRANGRVSNALSPRLPRECYRRLRWHPVCCRSLCRRLSLPCLTLSPSHCPTCSLTLCPQVSRSELASAVRVSEADDAHGHVGVSKSSRSLLSATYALGDWS